MPGFFAMPLLSTALMLAGLALPPIQAATPTHPVTPARRFLVTPESEFSYLVRTKLLAFFDEDVSGLNRQVTGAISFSNGHASGWLEAPVSGFNSGIKARDRHVAQLLGYPIVPIVRFELQRLEGFEPNCPEGNLLAIGVLMANGRECQLKVPLAYRLGEGRIRLSGEVAAKFSDFSIIPPILGFVLKRAPDDLLLRVNVVATEQPGKLH